jgi:hypothetical protein
MNETALDLIDRARAAAKTAAHACHDETARRHFEYTLALIGEAWIAESGQEARSPERITADVRHGLDLFAAVAAMPLPNHF